MHARLSNMLINMQYYGAQMQVLGKLHQIKMKAFKYARDSVVIRCKTQPVGRNA